MKKLIIFICSLTIIILTLVTPVSAQNYYNSVGGLTCKSDLLVSLDNDEVIVEKNADQPVSPASCTKIMTALVVLKNCPDLQKKMKVSKTALDSLNGTNSSTAGLKEDEEISIYDMLCCLLIPSGNDAAVALAAEVGGNIKNFVTMMNQTAIELGCQNTHFDNPHGLDSPTHKTTARDLSLMAKKALEYSAFKKIVSLSEYKLPKTNKNEERTITNTNFILNPTYQTYYYSYCKGIKTGNTDLAGQCLVSCASKDGYNYLAVTLGGVKKDTDGDKVEENQAFMDTLKMFKWAFEKLSYEQIAKPNQFVTNIPLNYCWKTDSMRLVAEKEAFALIPSGNDSQSVEFQPVDMPESIDAPVKAGEQICKAKIMYANQEIGEVNLVVAENANMSFLLYLKATFTKMTGHTLFKIIIILFVLFALFYLFMRIRSNSMQRKKKTLKIVKYSELERNTVKKKKKTLIKPSKPQPKKEDTEE